MILKAKDLRQKTDAQLKQSLKEIFAKQFELRMQLSGVTQNHLFGEMKRNVARIETILRERKGVAVND